MQKSAVSQLFKATTRAASTASSQASANVAAASMNPNAWRATAGKPLMRMRIRVNCAGIVQTSELSSVKYLHTARSYLHTKSTEPASELQHSSRSDYFAPQVVHSQHDVFVAGSNATYESLTASPRSRQFEADHDVYGPTNTVFSKSHDFE